MEKPNKALSGHATRGGWLRAALLSGLALGLMLGCGGANSKPAAPTITLVTPMSGNYLSATPVEVTGSGFVSGVTSLNISLGSLLTANVVLSGDTAFTFQVPAAAVTGQVIVTTEGGTAATPAGSPFIVIPYANSTTTNPTSGPGATLVTVTGYGLLGISEIAIDEASGAVAILPISQTANLLTFTIPSSAAAGSHTITLLNNYNTSVAPPLTIPFTVN